MQLKAVYLQLLNPRADHPCAPFLRNTLTLDLINRQKQELTRTIRRPPSQVDLHAIDQRQLIEPQTEGMQHLAYGDHGRDAPPPGPTPGSARSLDDIPAERNLELQNFTVGQVVAQHQVSTGADGAGLKPVHVAAYKADHAAVRAMVKTEGAANARGSLG